MRAPIYAGLGIGMALALAMPAAATPPDFSEQDWADIKCLVAMSVVVGRASGNDASSIDKASLGSVLTYFVGKLKGRHPALSMVDVMTPELYEKLAPELPAEMQRCGTEATGVGEDLQAAGKKLIAAGK